MLQVIRRSFSTKLSNFKVYPVETPVRCRALVDSIAESRDQQSFIAWHPKKEIPYECTKPLPTFESEMKSSLIKDEILDHAMRAHRHSYPDLVRENLSKLTFTTKHRWFPRSRDKKAKKTIMDRPYL